MDDSPIPKTRLYPFDCYTRSTVTMASSRKCCVPGCETSTKNKSSGTTFHNFPSRKIQVQVENNFGEKEVVDICKAWQMQLRMGAGFPCTSSVKVCSLHFNDNDFHSSGDVQRRRLKIKAVPSLHLPSKSLKFVTKPRRTLNKADPTHFESKPLLNLNIQSVDIEDQDIRPSPSYFPIDQSTIKKIKHEEELIDLEDVSTCTLDPLDVGTPNALPETTAMLVSNNTQTQTSLKLSKVAQRKMKLRLKLGTALHKKLIAASRPKMTEREEIQMIRKLSVKYFPRDFAQLVKAQCDLIVNKQH